MRSYNDCPEELTSCKLELQESSLSGDLEVEELVVNRVKLFPLTVKKFHIEDDHGT